MVVADRPLAGGLGWRYVGAARGSFAMSRDAGGQMVNEDRDRWLFCRRIRFVGGALAGKPAGGWGRLFVRPSTCYKDGLSYAYQYDRSSLVLAWAESSRITAGGTELLLGGKTFIGKSVRRTVAISLAPAQRTKVG